MHTFSGDFVWAVARYTEISDRCFILHCVPHSLFFSLSLSLIFFCFLFVCLLFGLRMYVDGVSIEPLYVDDPLVEAEKQVQSFICSKRSKRIGRRLVRRGRLASTVKNPTSILNLTYEPSFTLSLNVSATFSLCKFTIFSTIITEIRDFVKICLVACRIFSRLVFPILNDRLLR